MTYAAMIAAQRGCLSVVFPNDEPLFARQRRSAVPAILGMFGAITGLSINDVVEAVLEPEKKPEMLRKVSEHARASARRWPF